MAILHFISFLPPIIPIAFALYNKKDAVDAMESLTIGFTYAWNVATMFPCVTLNFQSVSVYIFLGVAALEILTYTIIIVGVQIYMLSHSFKMMKNNKHEKSLRLQRQLIVSIFLQVEFFYRKMHIVLVNHSIVMFDSPLFNHDWHLHSWANECCPDN
jgi:hypothetical protein